MIKEYTEYIKNKFLQILIFGLILYFLSIITGECIEYFYIVQNKQSNTKDTMDKIKSEPEIPSFDLFYDNILDLLGKENFIITASNNSKEVDLVLNKHANIKEAVSNKKFNSIDNLLFYVLLVHGCEKERELIKILAQDDSGSILYHIERIYSAKTKDFLKNGYYERLNILSDRAFVQLRDLDFPPNEEDVNNYLATNIWLYKSLFEYPEILANNIKSINILFDILESNFNDNKKALLNDVGEDGELFYLKKYWNAVFLFRDGRYEESIDEFIEINEKRADNYAIINLSNLMLARCIFWKAHKQMSNISQGEIELITSQLEEVLEQTQISSFKSDIEYYISEVKNWNNDKKNKNETAY